MALGNLFVGEIEDFQENPGVVGPDLVTCLTQEHNCSPLRAT